MLTRLALAALLAFMLPAAVTANPNETLADKHPRPLFVPLPITDGGRLLLLDKNHKPMRAADIRAIRAYRVQGNTILPAPARALDGRWGYLDANAQWALPPQFQEARSFSEEGLARVKLDKRWGFIGADLKFRIAPQFEEAEGFQNGLAAVQQKGKWGFVDTRGKLVVAPVFDAVWAFARNGLARVRKDGKDSGFIDRNGRRVIVAHYETALGFGEHEVSPASINRRWGLIDSRGNWVLKPIHSDIDFFNVHKLAAFRKSWTEIGYLNAQGQEVIPAHEGLSEHMAYNRVRLGSEGSGRFSFLDASGKVAIAGPFEWVGHFSEGGEPIPARRNGRWGLLTPKGEWLKLGEKREPFGGAADESTPGAGPKGLSVWLQPGQAIEWRDTQGQLVYRLEQKAAKEPGKFIAQLSHADQIIWTSHAVPGQLPLAAIFDPDAADLLKHKEENIPALAHRLLDAKPRRFMPCSRIFGSRNNPYDLSSIDPDQARSGAIEVLASSYVSETQYGRYDFLSKQRNTLFAQLHNRLCKRLSQDFGAPLAKPPTGITLDTAYDNKSCVWQTGKKYLALTHFFETGDGDFEHQIQLTAIQPSPGKE